MVDLTPCIPGGVTSGKEGMRDNGMYRYELRVRTTAFAAAVCFAYLV